MHESTQPPFNSHAPCIAPMVDYCGQIPKAAINFATKKGLPCFLEKAAVQLMMNEGKMTVVEQAKEL